MAKKDPRGPDASGASSAASGAASGGGTWQAYRTDEPFSGDAPGLAFYCPVCAFAEFGPRRRSDQEQAS
jgi:hypothetical protein